MTKPVLIRIEKDDQTNKQYSLISRNDKKLPELAPENIYDHNFKMKITLIQILTENPCL